MMKSEIKIQQAVKELDKLRRRLSWWQRWFTNIDIRLAKLRQQHEKVRELMIQYPLPFARCIGDGSVPLSYFINLQSSILSDPTDLNYRDILDRVLLILASSALPEVNSCPEVLLFTEAGKLHRGNPIEIHLAIFMAEQKIHAQNIKRSE